MLFCVYVCVFICRLRNSGEKFVLHILNPLNVSENAGSHLFQLAVDLLCINLFGITQSSVCKS